MEVLHLVDMSRRQGTPAISLTVFGGLGLSGEGAAGSVATQSKRVAFFAYLTQYFTATLFEFANAYFLGHNPPPYVNTIVFTL